MDDFTLRMDLKSALRLYVFLEAREDELAPGAAELYACAPGLSLRSPFDRGNGVAEDPPRQARRALNEAFTEARLR